MDVISDVIYGFGVALTPINLLYVLLGVVLGMAIGVLPGLGPAPTIALLLPLTFTIPTEAAIIMLAGIYYGAYYGGTVTSVLLRLPGEAASVVTTYDGYQMALKGRAGAALGISAIGSFAGGIFAVFGLMVAAPLIANIALDLGPPEYVALAAFGLLLATYLGARSFLKNLIVVGFGLFIASVGADPVSGAARFTFGSADLLGGIGFVGIVMGLFGIGDILYNLETEGRLKKVTAAVGSVWPSRADRKQSRGAIARGSVIGFLLGLMPGGGGVIGSMASYVTEKKISKNPERFGKGAIEGVAGPETANNAGSTAAFIPLLTLGIPSNVVLALIFGALLIQGVTPGPELINEHPEVFWGVICSMVIGNLFLLALSLPFVRAFVQLTRVRLGIMASIIVVITMAGIYSVNNNVFDMWIMVAFGVIGYIMRKTGYDPGPMALAIILGPLLETSFRQSMLISDGSLDVFVTRPLPAVLIAVVAVFGLLAIWRRIKRGRRGGLGSDMRDADPGNSEDGVNVHQNNRASD